MFLSFGRQRRFCCEAALSSRRERNVSDFFRPFSGWAEPGCVGLRIGLREDAVAAVATRRRPTPVPSTAGGERGGAANRSRRRRAWRPAGLCDDGAEWYKAEK